MSLAGFDEMEEKFPGENAEELYENAPCGYLSFVGNGTVILMNQTLLSWLGFDRSEITHLRKFQSLLTIGGRIFFETHFFPLIRIQGFVKEVSLELIRKDNSVLPVLLNVNEVSSSQGSQVVYRATIFDITDRKKYEKEILDARKKAEAAAQSKAELLATISHEIRTPLNAIIGMAALIQDTPLNEQQREYTRILKMSSDGLLGLVNDILDLSKIEKGKINLEERIFSVKEVAFTVAHTLRVKAEEKGVQLKVNLDEELPDYCVGDPLKLTQILTNLVGNAIKFTHAGFVKLEINIKAKDDDVFTYQFKVTDTGIGIPKDRLKAIFEEFSQVSYDVNLNYGGTGLGLTISQKLLQLHGSRMEVESQMGKGSEFSFLLTYKTSSGEPPIDYAPADAHQKKLYATRLLVVDDTPLNLLIVQEYLKKWGGVCDTASNGVEALELVKKHPYDVVLMDLQMPEMNGANAAKAIRDLVKGKQPIVIAMTASEKGDVSEDLKQSGFDGFLQKPFNSNDLYEVLLNYGRKDGQQKADEIQEISEKQDQKSYLDMSYYLQLTKGSKAGLMKILMLNISSFEQFRDQVMLAVEKKDKIAFDKSVHKIKMPLYYIQANELEAAIGEVRKLIEKNDWEVNLIKKKSDELKSIFDKVINALKLECLQVQSKKES